MSEDYAAIGCTSRLAEEHPPVPSQPTQCHACGGDLWISDIVVTAVARDNPGMEVRAFCFYTCMPQTDEPTTVPPEQRAYLREHHNLTDEQIDELIALSEMIRRRQP